VRQPANDPLMEICREPFRLLGYGDLQMTRPHLGPGNWIVVCDGRKALILENVGDLKFPNLRLKESYDEPSPPTHALGASPPGRTHQSMGHRRGAVAQTDWHDEAEHAFLRRLATRLDHAVAGHEVQKLTIVAAPRALGMIRKAYSPALENAVCQEISKDLVKATVSEIERQVFASATIG
jgi:protein required for attachment to host cells